MITPGITKYDVVWTNPSDNKDYFLRELVEEITLEDRLDEISLRGRIKLHPPTGDPFLTMPAIRCGQRMRISGMQFGSQDMVYLLQPGVIWEANPSNSNRPVWDVTLYDPTIYLAKSDDEYIMPAGQTASERLKQYAKDWNIPIHDIPDTGVKLAKGIYRSQAIWQIIQNDLKETATKGGKMYRPRWTPNGLTLFEIGSNQTVWVLEYRANLQRVSQKQSLDGVVTRVKILGNADGDNRSPVLATLDGNIKEYGVLQKVITDSKNTTLDAAKKAAATTLNDMLQESVDVTAIDINTIRAGDRVDIEGWPGLIVESVTHSCGSPGSMNLTLTPLELVRRKHYVAESMG